MADDADQAAQEQANTPEETAVEKELAALRAENQKLRDQQKAPADKTDAEPEAEKPKVGAVCNQCDSDSRQAPADPETGEVPDDRDDDSEFSLRDLLHALHHNSQWGHHVTLNDGDSSFTFNPRPQ